MDTRRRGFGGMPGMFNTLDINVIEEPGLKIRATNLHPPQTHPKRAAYLQHGQAHLQPRCSGNPRSIPRDTCYLPTKKPPTCTPPSEPNPRLSAFQEIQKSFLCNAHFSKLKMVPKSPYSPEYILCLPFRSFPTLVLRSCCTTQTLASKTNRLCMVRAYIR